METPTFELPEGAITITQDLINLRATVNKARIGVALVAYFRKGLNSQPDLLKAMEEMLHEHKHLSDAEWDHIARVLAASATLYIQGQLDQAVADAVNLVLYEATNRPTAFMVDWLGADEATQRAALPPREAIENKALEYLRRRLSGLSFRGRGPVAEWTALSLSAAILDAMAKIENPKNRAKWRVAGMVFKEDLKTREQRQAITTRLNSLMNAHGVDYAEMERTDNKKRGGKGKR